MGGLEIVTSANDLEQGLPQSGNYNQRQYEMRNVPRSEYHERFVEGNLQHRPWLDILHQFMNPNAEGFAVNLKSSHAVFRHQSYPHFEIRKYRITNQMPYSNRVQRRSQRGRRK